MDKIYIYTYLLYISLFPLIFLLWISLSYVDRIHLRERARRYGVQISKISSTVIMNDYIYDKCRILIIRPICALCDFLAGIFEGMENLEPIIKIMENKKDFLCDVDTINNLETESVTESETEISTETETETDTCDCDDDKTKNCDDKAKLNVVNDKMEDDEKANTNNGTTKMRRRIPIKLARRKYNKK